MTDVKSLFSVGYSTLLMIRAPIYSERYTEKERLRASQALRVSRHAEPSECGTGTVSHALNHVEAALLP